MKIVARLVAALAFALLLPFPGPHVDRYTPVASVLFRRDALDADAGFFVLIGVVIAIYTAIVFGGLSLLRLALNRRTARDPDR
jgi:hypothetical protein